MTTPFAAGETSSSSRLRCREKKGTDGRRAHSGLRSGCRREHGARSCRRCRSGSTCCFEGGQGDDGSDDDRGGAGRAASRRIDAAGGGRCSRAGFEAYSQEAEDSRSPCGIPPVLTPPTLARSRLPRPGRPGRERKADDTLTCPWKASTGMLGTAPRRPLPARSSADSQTEPADRVDLLLACSSGR